MLRDYSFDWTDWLDGDAICKAEFDLNGGRKTARQEFTDAVATFWFDGQFRGTVMHTIETARGRRTTIQQRFG